MDNKKLKEKFYKIDKYELVSNISLATIPSLCLVIDIIVALCLH